MNTSTTFLAITLCLFQALAPRKYFFLAFVVAACCVPTHQRFDIMGLDFTVERLLILISILKLMNGGTRIIKWNMFDKLILSWVIVGSVFYIAQQGSFSAVIYKCGFMFDSLGLFWLFRQVLNDCESIARVIRFLAFFSILTAPLIAAEKYLEPSFFSIFGPTMAQFHHGRFRAAGPFPHFIVMGCFWASLLPLFYAQIKANKNIYLFGIAIISSLSNIYFAASSTPVMTVLALIIFWNIFYYRQYGNIIFQCICLSLLFLHLIMKAPVWHLMARVNVFGGSTGYHRYFLFNNFVNNWSEWFYLGTKSTAHWGHVQSDITNQFVLEGVRGGVLTLLLFVAVVYFSVKVPWRFSTASTSKELQWLSWGICISMLGHFVTFWGISYFGQINFLLFFVFALVSFTLDKNIEALS